MNVLVTGAAGFIGSNLVYFLRKKRPNWKIVALDLLTYAGNIENIASLIEKKEIEFVRADIADADSVSKVFASNSFDYVFHLAAESHVDRSIHDPLAFVRTNVGGTQVLLDAARKAKIKRFVHISTDEVYGSLGADGFFTEITPLDPSSPYSASKAGSDLMVLAAGKTFSFDVVITRCTNNYGPFQFPEKLIPLFITNAVDNIPLPLYGDGMNVRSWLFVDDHCAALLAAAENGKSGEVYNIGPESDSELPNKVVTSQILKILGKPDTLVTRVADRPAHDRRYAVDNSKARKDLSWTPSVNFQDGLAATVKWYIQNEGWWRTIKSGEYRNFYEKNYAGRGSAK